MQQVVSQTEVRQFHQIAYLRRDRATQLILVEIKTTKLSELSNIRWDVAIYAHLA